MELLDEHGRVFGVVNIIDLLVVLFVVAVGIAGIALVTDGTVETVIGLLFLLIVVGGIIAGARFVADGQATRDDGDESLTVTVELISKSWRETVLTSSETVRFDGREYTVTDVYRTPTETKVRTTAVLRSTGPVNGESVAANEGLRYGTDGRLTTPTYALDATVVDIGGDETVPTVPVTATLVADVSPAVADAVEAGDEHQVAGQSMATIQEVTHDQTAGPHDRLAVDITFVARETVSGPVYGDRPLRIGRRLTVATNEYEFVGTITELKP
ncbi:DUF4330 family protein [Halosegnis longus]|uniref:DUF4330 family protein n=1 Tax=Halosegnis longus TaxID=2216012 RepID=UPI00096A80D8|nr:DUF4330 family protein [Salella cibi]